jgi:hypothetical protein
MCSTASTSYDHFYAAFRHILCELGHELGGPVSRGDADFVRDFELVQDLQASAHDRQIAIRAHGHRNQRHALGLATC